MARSMFSLGMLFSRAVRTAERRRGLALMSPPPMRAATVISLIILVNSLPRLESLAAFLCLMELHLECPDMKNLLRRIGGLIELRSTSFSASKPPPKRRSGARQRAQNTLTTRGGTEYPRKLRGTSMQRSARDTIGAGFFLWTRRTWQIAPGSGRGRWLALLIAVFMVIGLSPVSAQQCGNGIVEPPEECDDGNTVSGDGCDANCQVECHADCAVGRPMVPRCDSCVASICAADAYCCNVQWDAICVGETTSICGIPCPVCGNGVLEVGEQCDDGNTVDGDGCDAACAIEPG